MLTAQEASKLEIKPLRGDGHVDFNLKTGVARATNGVVVTYGDGVLTADEVEADQISGEVSAHGSVRIQRDNQIWVSEHVLYNFKTRRFEAQQFRSGKTPVFASGQGLGVEFHHPRYISKLMGTTPSADLSAVIGVAPDKIRKKDKLGAEQASTSAALNPASGNDALVTPIADLNTNGFITLDEVLAIKQSGATDEQLLGRLAGSGYVFELTPQQRSFLWSRGLGQAAVDLIPRLNPEVIESLNPAPRTETVAGLALNPSSYVYTATNATITADDVSEPLLNVRARKIRIQPGHRIEAEDAVLYAGKVPVFYFPYYTRNLRENANHFSFLPGYRRTYGGFLLSSYNWYLNDTFDGGLHLDYRTERGLGGGPDVNYHLGQWGEGTFRYYYMHDENPDKDVEDAGNPKDRQRVYFTYLANPTTNLSVRSMVRWQADTNIVREFFEGEYRQNPQPSTFVEANKFWQNFSLDFYAQPRLNEWQQTVERLPDVRFTGFAQQLGNTPVYYESESSLGYYRQLFPEIESETLGLNYEAARADTYHQFTLPQTFFGWLRFTPRVGGRYTYYTDADGPGGFTDQEHRGVFNTGAEISFKASRLWPGIQNRLLDLDGLRHIVEPSFNYVYVPDPTVSPRNLPQFDREWPSFRLLPIDFPDYRAIDSIDSQNVLRLGLRNKLQTKRQAQVDNVLKWDLYTDWRIDPREDQTHFADTFSDVSLKPRDWLTLESMTRYDVEGGSWRMAYHMATFQPNNIWSWGFGHLYLQDYYGDPTAWGEGNNLLMSTLMLRWNENWGFRAHHRYDFIRGRLEEQAYTVFRDLRSWTAGLSFRVRNNPQGEDDVSVAFTFSIKAIPRSSLGNEAMRDYSLWGN